MSAKPSTAAYATGSSAGNRSLIPVTLLTTPPRRPRSVRLREDPLSYAVPGRSRLARRISGAVEASLAQRNVIRITEEAGIYGRLRRFCRVMRFFPVIVWLVERLHVDLCRLNSRLCP